MCWESEIYVMSINTLMHIKKLIIIFICFLQLSPEFLELVQESGLVIEEEVSPEETNCVGELCTTKSELNYSAVLQSVQSTSNSPLPDTPCTCTERTEETPIKNKKRKRDTLNKANEVMEEALTRLKALRARAHWPLCSTTCGRALWRGYLFP